VLLEPGEGGVQVEQVVRRCFETGQSVEIEVLTSPRRPAPLEPLAFAGTVDEHAPHGLGGGGKGCG
jgi:hypothetical protein